MYHARAGNVQVQPHSDRILKFRQIQRKRNVSEKSPPGLALARRIIYVYLRRGDGAPPKKTEGKKFYESHYVNTQPNIHIRERFKEQYMVTGSCQILSDKKKVGWHPNFKDIV